jgi:ABC-2 type transport system ATP-binding protein
MIHDPKILILDEPVTGLDPNQIVEIRSLIKRLGRKKLVLMSSHILQEIQATVDRIIIIDHGKIVADGTSDELISDAQGMTQLHLEISNTEENSIQDMKATIPGVNVKKVSKNGENFNVQLEYASSADPRKEIFSHAVANSWIITEMRVTEKNLEDIFRNLTGKIDNGATNE